MNPPDAHSNHELRQCYIGKVISLWTLFDPSGHGILYLGGAAVVEGFQPKCSSVGFRTRAGSVNVLDLVQT